MATTTSGVSRAMSYTFGTMKLLKAHAYSWAYHTCEVIYAKMEGHFIATPHSNISGTSFDAIGVKRSAGMRSFIGLSHLISGNRTIGLSKKDSFHFGLTHCSVLELLRLPVHDIHTMSRLPKLLPAFKEGSSTPDIKKI